MGRRGGAPDVAVREDLIGNGLVGRRVVLQRIVHCVVISVVEEEGAAGVVVGVTGRVIVVDVDGAADFHDGAGAAGGGASTMGNEFVVQSFDAEVIADDVFVTVEPFDADRRPISGAP